jgi:hypothetical protein
MHVYLRALFVAGALGLVTLVACSSATSPSSAEPVDAGLDVPDADRDDANDAADAADAPRCTGDASDPCVKCDLASCCDEREACLEDTACKAAYHAQIACIASTASGTVERHSCFMTFETKGKKAQTYHFCEEDQCRAATACAIP